MGLRAVRRKFPPSRCCEFSALLGNDSGIRFAGVVKGSAVLRAYVSGQAEQVVQVRLLQAKTLPESPAAEQLTA